MSFITTLICFFPSNDTPLLSVSTPGRQERGVGGKGRPNIHRVPLRRGSVRISASEGERANAHLVEDISVFTSVNRMMYRSEQIPTMMKTKNTIAKRRIAFSTGLRLFRLPNPSGRLPPQSYDVVLWAALNRAAFCLSASIPGYGPIWVESKNSERRKSTNRTDTRMHKKGFLHTYAAISASSASNAPLCLRSRNSRIPSLFRSAVSARGLRLRVHAHSHHRHSAPNRSPNRPSRSRCPRTRSQNCPEARAAG